MITLTIAAGRAIKKFSLNLSVILQPCPLQAAMVVSEIKDRLSPNIAPLMTEAMQQRHGKAGGLCNGSADGDNQRNCADRGAHGERYKTADDEKHRNRELRRNQRENEVGNAVCGGSADNADKNPCQHEDENHRDNTRVADAGAHNGKLIIERQGAVLQTGNKQGNQKYDNNRDFVNAPISMRRPYSNNMPRPKYKTTNTNMGSNAFPFLFSIFFFLPMR